MKKQIAWKDFVGNYHTKRAIEVAIAGNHSIAFHGNPANGKEQLQTIIGNSFFLSPCKCGNFGDMYKECLCTPTQIKKHRQLVKYRKGMASDIVIEVIAPHVHDYSDNICEPFKAVLERIKNMATHTINDNEHTANELLKVAISKLGLNMNEVSSIKAVAYTIAKLEGSDNIKAEHIAEAIQYKSL